MGRAQVSWRYRQAKGGVRPAPPNGATEPHVRPAKGSRLNLENDVKCSRLGLLQITWQKGGRVELLCETTVRTGLSAGGLSFVWVGQHFDLVMNPSPISPRPSHSLGARASCFCWVARGAARLNARRAFFVSVWNFGAD